MGVISGSVIAGFFGGGVEAMVLVCGLEVSLRVDPCFFRAGFFAPALARGYKTAVIVHKVVAYEDLFLLHDGVPTDFGEGDAVLDFLECLFDGRRRRPWGDHLVFV